MRWARTLAFPSPRKFKELIKGQEIKEVTRRAKYFILRLSDFSLLIHLRMSGDLFIKESKIKPEKHDRLILTLAALHDRSERAGRSRREQSGIQRYT